MTSPRLVFAALLFLSAAAGAQTWQPLNHPAAFGAGAMLLLTDGTVLVHAEQSNSSQWSKLTPDASGSYVNGTWSSSPDPRRRQAGGGRREDRMLWALLAAYLTKRPIWVQAVVFGLCTGLFVSATWPSTSSC